LCRSIESAILLVRELSGTWRRLSNLSSSTEFQICSMGIVPQKSEVRELLGRRAVGEEGLASAGER
jgi:hypothetical protein